MSASDEILRKVYDPQSKTLIVRVDATDNIVGDLKYDYHEVLTDCETITSSFNAIAKFIHDEYYEETFAVEGYQDITKASGVLTYTITKDENATVPVLIEDGNVIIQDINKFVIKDMNGNPVYKQGSLIKSEDNLVKVIAYNPVTKEITLNFEPKTDFRVHYLIKYNRVDLPNGKALTNGIFVVENAASRISYDNTNTNLGAGDVQEALSELDSKVVYKDKDNTINGTITIDNGNFIVKDDQGNEILRVDENGLFVRGVRVTGTYGG